LLLSGGRLFTEGLIDIELWVSSDGMGTRWVRKSPPDTERTRSLPIPAHSFGLFSAAES
jgi:hypothetical protein